MGELQIFDDIIEEIAARLDLRDPNAQALRTISATVSQYYDVESHQPPFEAVVASATGVGKTYILAGSIEMFAIAHGVRDFVVITPGSTILEKTKANFTPGHTKSLLGPMSVQPVVITADNFATPTVRSAMDDPDQIKLYLFTVQSLTKPQTKNSRRTRKFQEGLGEELYSHLQSLRQLVVLADEHHTYYGPAFSAAVRDLNPWVLIGLTATPHKDTPKDQIIFKYPLAAAIADKLVKTPVIVGRKDDRTDAETKLADGITLLTAKAEALVAYAKSNGLEPVNPVMLVVPKTIADADEVGHILRSTEFFNGVFADAVLVVHSNAPDEALAALESVEDSSSPVRIIISVGMLKEGWDVRNVYVIASLRASVSEILTEQTLGRGMRLPYGHYTDVELLDTLEVIAHERYQELLQRRNVLNEAFIDYRVWAATRTNSQGQLVVVSQTSEAGTEPIVGETAPEVVAETLSLGWSAAVTPVENRTAEARSAVEKIKQEVLRNPAAPILMLPVLRMTSVSSPFTLTDITDFDAFRKLGVSLAADPEGELSRTLFSARVVVGLDGIKRTELIRQSAADRIISAPTLFPIDALRTHLVDMVLTSPSVPARPKERAAVAPLISAFLDGLGDKAEEVLSANLERAAARLIRLVESEQRRFQAKPTYEEVVELKELSLIRVTEKSESTDRLGPFSKSVAYGGWKRSLFSLAWFDSEPERRVANMLDADDSVAWWVRLHLNDLPILWNSGGQHYNPDLLAIDKKSTHWLIEVKMEKEIQSAEVQAKREAAQRWVNSVNADEQVTEPWRYLLLAESDIDDANGSWRALKELGS